MRQLLSAAVAVLALDQISKYLVVHVLALEQVQYIAVFPPYLQFRMAWNRGINFGLLSNTADLTRWLLILLALAISVWIWIWARRERSNQAVQIFAGILIGGALGNVIDRLFYGAVADFLNTSLPGWDNPYSFNVADVAIFLGAFGLVFFAGRHKTP
ncbi:MAG: signal peptidase II [Albidovulum sp.]|jgi:signal peptidase II